jgi:hypothetical protein
VSAPTLTAAAATPVAEEPPLRPAIPPPPDPEPDPTPQGAEPAGRQQQETHDPAVIILLAVLTSVGGAILAGIGFSGSYTTLRNLALHKGFGTFSYAFPVGVDVGILVLLAMEIFLLHKRIRLPFLRWIAHCLTVATILFNAAAAPGPITRDPLAAAMHGVIPVLFIATTEAARHYIGRMANILAGQEDRGSVPLSRWILAPISTPRIFRRMIMFNLAYDDVVAQDQELRIYRESLRQRYGGGFRGWRSKASADEMLPFKMGRYGYSVDQALAAPLLEECRRIQRETNAAIQRAQAEIQRVQADLQVGSARIQAQVEEIRNEGQLRLARAEAEQAVQAELQEREAEFQARQTELQSRLALLQAEGEAKAKELAVATERRIAQARMDGEKEQVKWEEEQRRLRAEATAEEEQRAFESQIRAAENAARLKAAGAQQLREAREHEAATLKAEEAAAEHRRRIAEHQRAEAEDAAETEKAEAATAAAKRLQEEEALRAAELRRRAAELDAAAVEDAATARLNQVDWDARRVAAMILVFGETATTVERIADKVGCSTGTAVQRKAKALELLAEGYQPGARHLVNA